MFILGYKGDPDTEEILKKIRRVEKTENIKIETKNILYGKYSSSKAKDCLAKYIEANGLDFTAVYAHSFKMIQGVYELFFERKIAIPDDISVIGTSHDASNTILYPPLTFLERPYYDVGRLAVEELVHKIEKGGTTVKREIDSSLIIQDSTKYYSKI